MIIIIPNEKKTVLVSWELGDMAAVAWWIFSIYNLLNTDTRININFDFPPLQPSFYLVPSDDFFRNGFFMPTYYWSWINYES